MTGYRQMHMDTFGIGVSGWVFVGVSERVLVGVSERVLVGGC